MVWTHTMSTVELHPMDDIQPPVIEFVNHASFICEFNGLRIMSDPWLFGTAFNDGWQLLCDYQFDIDRFRDIDYIWISHEHPDHFSPLVIKTIPEEIRHNITVLFQETRDRKVIDYCGRIGFQTRELVHCKPVKLADDFTVICGRVPFYDSWILYDCNGTKILNINDCIVDGDASANAIRKIVGPVDLLFTQFSYAGWKGNPDETELRQKFATLKLRTMQTQIEAFKPEWTVPFASFAYFSHVENRHTNDSINKPQDAINAIIEAGSKPVLMYPGDKWSVGVTRENEQAINRYEKDYDISKKEFSVSTEVTESELLESSYDYISRIRSQNNRLILKCIRYNPCLRWLRPIDILVYDLQTVYNFSLERGLVEKTDDTSYDVRIHSSSLSYLFRFNWGFDTLTINGRFKASMDGYKKMKKTFALGSLNNSGHYIEIPSLVQSDFFACAGPCSSEVEEIRNVKSWNTSTATYPITRV